jgi:high-affinity iron transporter
MSRRGSGGRSVLVALAALLVIGILVWQAVTTGGIPDPTVKHLSPAAAVVDTGILVFREGLESILVLSAITASLSRTRSSWGRPVAAGAGVAFATTIATWFVVVAILSDVNAPELDLQAATGLLAVVILLVIMNWFFHKVYWTRWITHHTRAERELLENPGIPPAVVFRGLALLGFASVYREGFEVVLFLQSLRLQVGEYVVFLGSLIGVYLTLLVAALNFLSHYRLPYRKMLVLTGILLGGVLVVMVGETVQEMQQARWLATTPLLHFALPGWMNVWFSLYNSWESLTAQVLTVVVVIGSYLLAEYVRVWRPGRRTAPLAQEASDTRS